MKFVARRKVWFLISLVFIGAGVLSLVTQGLNLGIDFSGGNIIQVQFGEDVPATQVREVLVDHGLGGSSVQSAQGNQFIIRTRELTEGESDQLLLSLEEKVGSLEVLRNEKVGAVIGRELTTKAVYALIIAIVLMIAYITVRFEFYFGLAAIIALVHDVLITVGLISIFAIEIDSAFVAAVLTVVGYSINDTIVVFDRIRENLRLHRKENVEEVVDLSIRQTLARSINTALTVIIALVALLVLGGATTKVFALAMLVGTIAGTYSSIFIASPLWVILGGRRQRHRKRAQAY